MEREKKRGLLSISMGYWDERMEGGGGEGYCLYPWNTGMDGWKDGGMDGWMEGADNRILNDENIGENR